MSRKYPPMRSSHRDPPSSTKSTGIRSSHRRGLTVAKPTEEVEPRTEPKPEYAPHPSIGIVDLNGSKPAVVVAVLQPDRSPKEEVSSDLEYRFVVVATDDEVARFADPDIRARAIFDLTESFEMERRHALELYLSCRFSMAEARVRGVFEEEGERVPARIQSTKNGGFPLLGKAHSLAQEICGVYRRGARDVLPRYEPRRLEFSP